MDNLANGLTRCNNPDTGIILFHSLPKDRVIGHYLPQLWRDKNWNEGTHHKAKVDRALSEYWKQKKTLKKQHNKELNRDSLLSPTPAARARTHPILKAKTTALYLRGEQGH